MKKATLLSALLFSACWVSAQSFELRLANAGNGVIAVEMRETSGRPPKTSDLQTDLVFGICWDKSYNIDLGAVTTNYTIRKAGPETVRGNLEYQQFAKDPNPLNFATNWGPGQWVTIMQIPNNMASNHAKGTFSVCPTALQELNINYNLVDYPVTAAGNAVDVQIGSPLPKKLKVFSATLDSSLHVDLDWLTISEQEYVQYELEHSVDGVVFHKFATIPARGGTDSRYTYTHQPQPNGSNYYRLKMVESQGRYEYSPVRLIQLEGRDDWQIMPNPSTGTFVVVLEALAEEDIQLSVTDVSGRTLYQEVLTMVPGTNRQTVRLKGTVSAGMYQVNVRRSDGTMQAKPLFIVE